MPWTERNRFPVVNCALICQFAFHCFRSLHAFAVPGCSENNGPLVSSDSTAQRPKLPRAMSCLACGPLARRLPVIICLERPVEYNFDAQPAAQLGLN